MKSLIACLLISLCGASAIAEAEDRPLGSAMTLEQLTGKASNRRTERPPILERPPIMNVSPAAEPVPALKYRFRPASWEKTPTSAMLHYMRANTNLLDRGQRSWQQYETEAWLMKNHPNGPSPEQLAGAIDSLESVFEQIHELALAEDFSWDHRLRDLQGPAVYQYLLPDVQQVRRLARFLILRVRHKLNQNDLNGAIQSAGDGIRLAEFVNNGEFAIQQLVAIAIASITSDEIILEVIQHPDSPNLYWALAAIPRPIVRVTESMHWEFHAIHQVLPMLREAETEEWTEQQAQSAWSKMIENLKATGALTDSAFVDSAISLTARGVTQGKPARNRLRSMGFSDERLAQMPDLQCVLADASLEITRMTDDMMKGLLLPNAISSGLRLQAEQRYQNWRRATPPSVGALVGRPLTPVTRQVKEAERRAHMRFNRLMTLEAMRMHAAEHNGQLPKTLDELSPVPAMPDPYTGEHFDYRLESDDNGQVVVLEAAGPTSHLFLRELRFRFRH